MLSMINSLSCSVATFLVCLLGYIHYTLCISTTVIYLSVRYVMFATGSSHDRILGPGTKWNPKYNLVYHLLNLILKRNRKHNFILFNGEKDVVSISVVKIVCFPLVFLLGIAGGKLLVLFC